MTRRGFFRPRIVSGTVARLEPVAADRFKLHILPHLDAAYNFARYLTRDATLAEDVVQEAFLRAFRSFDGWRGDNPRAWLLAIVRNCHVDAATGRRDPLKGAEAVETIDRGATSLVEVDALEDRAARQDEAARLRQTIEGLPEPFRETLVLRELEELNYKEIAAITQVPVGTVMSRLARARAMLCALLLPPEETSMEARR